MEPIRDFCRRLTNLPLAIALVTAATFWSDVSLAQNRAANDNDRQQQQQRAANENYRKQQQEQAARQRRDQEQAQARQEQLQRQQQVDRANSQAAQAQAQTRQQQNATQLKNAQQAQQNTQAQQATRTQQQQQQLREQKRRDFQQSQVEQRQRLQGQKATAAAANAQATATQARQRQIKEAARQPTPGEIQKGFTGRTTGDGRALVKFKNRILVVPASRISGLGARLERDKALRTSQRWNAEKQRAVNSRVQQLAAVGLASNAAPLRSSKNPPGGPTQQSTTFRSDCPGAPLLKPEPGHAANMNCGEPFRTKADEYQHNRAVDIAKNSTERVLVLGKYPNYLRAGFAGNADTFFLSNDDWKSKEKEFHENYASKTGQSLESLRKNTPQLAEANRQFNQHMFDTANRAKIDQYINNGGRIILSSPYVRMKNQGLFSALELEYLESKGYKLSPDGSEMVRRP